MMQIASILETEIIQNQSYIIKQQKSNERKIVHI
jgi:hypothetical protein